MKISSAIPTFRIFDYTLARAFYIDWLGFKLDWENQTSPPKGPWYAQISRDDAVLHLTEHYGDSTPGSKAFIAIDDVAALHQEINTRPNPNMNPSIQEAPWNARIMEVTDPFGNKICFNQSLD